MKKLVISLLFFLSAQPIYALLPPLYQSVTEIRSILENPELGQYLPQTQPILEIQKSRDGYLILTNQLQMQVEIQYLQQQRPGPQQFNTVFHQPIPIGRQQ